MAWTKPPRALWNLLFGAFVIRWVGLEKHALSAEEAWRLTVASRDSLGEALRADPSLTTTALARATRALLGSGQDGAVGEDRLRMPFALLGVLAVLLVWRLGRRLLPAVPPPTGPAGPEGGPAAAPSAPPGVGLLWTAALAFAPTFVAVGQQAHPAGLLLVGVLALASLHLSWIDRGAPTTLIAAAFVGLLCLLTDPSALLALLGLALHAAVVWRRRRRHPGPGEPPASIAAPLLAYGAAVLGALALASAVGADTAGPVRAAAPVSPFPAAAEGLMRALAGPALLVIDGQRRGQDAAQVLGSQPWLPLALALAWLPVLLLGVAAVLRRPLARGLLLGGAVLLLGGATLLSPRGGADGAVAALPLWGLALLGAGSLPTGLRRAAWGLLGAGAGLGLLAYHGVEGQLSIVERRRLNDEEVPVTVASDPADPTAFLHGGHPYGSEAWREVSALVQHYAGPGDLVLLGPGLPRLAWPWYARERRAGPLDTRPWPAALPDAAGWAQDPDVGLGARARAFLVLGPEGPDPEASFRTLFKACVKAWALDAAAAPAGRRGQVNGVPPVTFRRAGGLFVAFVERR